MSRLGYTEVSVESMQWLIPAGHGRNCTDVISEEFRRSAVLPNGLHVEVHLKAQPHAAPNAITTQIPSINAMTTEI